MPTSTLQTYALQGVNYVWDGVTGILFTAGMAQFFVAMLIIIGTLAIIMGAIKGVFKFK